MRKITTKAERIERAFRYVLALLIQLSLTASLCYTLLFTPVKPILIPILSLMLGGASVCLALLIPVTFKHIKSIKS